jgi:hypothetical protein
MSDDTKTQTNDHVAEFLTPPLFEAAQREAELQGVTVEWIARDALRAYLSFHDDTKKVQR